MAQLIYQQDPYVNQNEAAVANLAGSLGGPGPEQMAQYQVLAAKMREADAQQQKLKQQMQFDAENQGIARKKWDWEQQQYKQGQDAQEAAGRYFGYSTPAPVGVNGAPPSREDMERYYREQNYRDQSSRAAIRAGKGTEDISKGMGDFETNFRNAHPAPVNAPSGNAQTFQVPPTPPGLGPDGTKKFQELNAARASKFYEGQAGSGKLLEDTVRARQAYDQGRGYIGPVQGNSVYRSVQSMLPEALGGQSETRRSDVDNKLAAYQKSLVIQNLPPGPASDKDIEQARKGMASVRDTSPEAGLASIDRDLAQVVKNMGYDIPASHISELMRDIKTQNTAEIQNFIAAHPGSQQVVKMIYESMR
jgi:hypothetical protein